VEQTVANPPAPMTSQSVAKGEEEVVAMMIAVMSSLVDCRNGKTEDLWK